MVTFFFRHGNTAGFFLLLALCGLILSTVAGNEVEAGFLGRFSLSTAEQYSDNVLFSGHGQKEGDFVTTATPALSLAYKASGQTLPSLMANLTTSAEFFAQHSELNNFGDNVRADINYFHPYSPRLDFTFTDRLERHGQSRLDDSEGLIGGNNSDGPGGGRGFSGIGGMSGLGGLSGFAGSGSTTCGRIGSMSRGDSADVSSRSGGDLLARGEWLENQIGVNGNFLYTSTLSFRGGYCWEYAAYLDEGGQENAHSINLEASYQRSSHNRLYARYTPSLIRSRDGQYSIVHDFDLGSDYLQLREFRLTPTLILSASTGLGVQTGEGGDNSDGESSNKFRLRNNLDVHITKIWEAASARAGVRRGLTSSFGVSGPSYTTTFFGYFSVKLTRRLSAGVGTEYSLYDTGDTKFRTLQTFVGLQYPLSNAMVVGLGYSYNQLDPGTGAAENDILAQGKTSSNTAFVFLSVAFDVWPNVGLARGARNPYP